MFKDQTTIVREFRMASQKVQNKSMSEKVFAQVLSEVSGFARPQMTLQISRISS